MIKLFQVAFLISMVSSCKPSKSDSPIVQTFLMDIEYLATAKKGIQENEPRYTDAFQQLIKDADRALEEGPFSVTDKEKLPPSGDKHDYASYSRYWWPDPDQPDGLPYIRKDGQTNPESQNLTASDRPRIGALGKNCESLGLAYYYTGNKKYAIKVAQLLRVWFLEKETSMNPNVNHAQCRPGHNLGSKSGVLDGRLMVRALEGSLLIATSGEMTDLEMKGLQDWASEYFHWLTTNKMALQEAKSNNNHGSYYDAQAIYYALYSKNNQAAKSIALAFENRLLSQIQPDGSMPEEMARTRPLFYSMYNLQAMFIVATLAQKVDVDIWSLGDGRLRSALDYLSPYSDPNIKWPTPTLGEVDRMELFPILLIADKAFPEGNYIDMADKLPLLKRKKHTAQLAYPVMR